MVAEITVDARAVANAMAGSTGIDVERASTSTSGATTSTSTSASAPSLSSASAFSLAETALSEPADAFDSWLLTEAGLQDWVSFCRMLILKDARKKPKKASFSRPFFPFVAMKEVQVVFDLPGVTVDVSLQNEDKGETATVLHLPLLL